MPTICVLIMIKWITLRGRHHHAPHILRTAYALLYKCLYIYLYSIYMCWTHWVHCLHSDFSRQFRINIFLISLVIDGWCILYIHMYRCYCVRLLYMHCCHICLNSVRWQRIRKSQNLKTNKHLPVIVWMREMLLILLPSVHHSCICLLWFLISYFAVLNILSWLC